MACDLWQIGENTQLPNWTLYAIYPLWLFNIAMEKGLFIEDLWWYLPIKNCDFQFATLNNQTVYVLGMISTFPPNIIPITPVEASSKGTRHSGTRSALPRLCGPDVDVGWFIKPMSYSWSYQTNINWGHINNKLMDFVYGWFMILSWQL